MKRSNGNAENKINTNGDKKPNIPALLKNRLIIILLIALFAEIFVCNYKCFDPAVLFSEKIDAENIYTQWENVSRTDDGSYVKNSDDAPELKIKNINGRVRSVYLDADRANAHNIDIVISVSDSASQKPYTYNGTSIIKSVETSKYLRLNTAGTTKEMSVKFTNLDKGEKFSVSNISFNAVRPFMFLRIRFIFIFAVLLLLYALRPSSEAYKVLYTGKLWQRAILLLIVTASVLFLFWVAKTTSGEHGDKFNSSMYNEAAQGWVDGQLSLPEEPPKELEYMEDPYDTTMRSFGYKWDSAYYNGKYYMYFGVVPLALLHYPAKLIFHKDLSCYMVCFFFALLAVLGAYIIMEGINKRWLRNRAPFIVYALSLAILIFSSGIYYLCRSPSFYVTAQTSAMAFGMLGLGCWLNACREGKINKIYLFSGSLFMAMTVGCRPNYVLYSFVFIPLFWDSLIKKLVQRDRDTVISALCVVLPYAVTAVLLMVYNYMRFDSPFDFGNNYQLTVYNMRYSFNLNKLPLGIWIMYFQPAVISNGFPFVSEIGYRIGYQGQLYLVHTMGGLFFTNVIALFLFKMKVLKDRHKNSGMLSFSAVFTALAVLESLVIFSTSGLLLRYTLDYVWCFIVPALLTANIIIIDNRDKALFRPYIKIFLLCFWICMLYNILISFRGEVDSFRHDWPSLYYAIERAVSFWL